MNFYDNEKLSKLSNSSKLEFFNWLNKYYLDLRSNIDISDRDTFGFEMEAECFDYSKVYNEMINNSFDLSKWIIKPDRSLYHGYEVVTPILDKENINWEKINLICNIIKNNSKVGMRAASHIHVGAQALNDDRKSIIRFIMLWGAYENVLFRFGYGEFLNQRNYIFTYSKPQAFDFLRIINVLNNHKELDTNTMIKWISKDENNSAVNLVNVKSLSKILDKNTIEFRLFNYTLNPIIWQNNYNLVIHLLRYCNNDNFDYDTVKNRIEINNGNFNKLCYYHKLDTSGALELADLLFDKNIDKIYFLRQYFKNMEETDGKYLMPAKQFTKIPLNIR